MPMLQPISRLNPPVPVAPFDPSTVQADPGIGWRLSQGTKALQASAAQRGTLLTGATQKALVDYGQNAASQEYENAYRRTLDTYRTNRDTNAQNFNQNLYTPSDVTSTMHTRSPSWPLSGTTLPSGDTEADRWRQAQPVTPSPQPLNGPYNPYNDPAALAAMRADAAGSNQRAFTDQKAAFDQQLADHERQSAATAVAAPRTAPLSTPTSAGMSYQDTVARLERQQQEQEQRAREQAARENAARGDQRLVPAYLRQYVGVGRG